MNINLIKPSLTYQNQLTAYRNEYFAEHPDTPAIHGGGGIEMFNSIPEWVIETQRNEKKETVREGWVTASQYIAIDDNDVVVGMIQIRHELNDFLYSFGGHIGYSVRPNMRKKGIATMMLKLALKKCMDEHKIKDILVTCSSWNTASIKTIINNGGVFEDERKFQEEMKKRYWITLN